MFEYIHNVCLCASTSKSAQTRYTARVLRMRQFHEDSMNPRNMFLSVLMRGNHRLLFFVLFCCFGFFLNVDWPCLSGAADKYLGCIKS